MLWGHGPQRSSKRLWGLISSLNMCAGRREGQGLHAGGHRELLGISHIKCRPGNGQLGLPRLSGGTGSSTGKDPREEPQGLDLRSRWGHRGAEARSQSLRLRLPL